MAGDWPILTLQDVCETITDGAHASPKDFPGGLPMASVKDMARWGIDVKSSRTIAPNDFDDLVRNGCQPQVGDVLIAKDGATCLDTVCEFKQPDKIVLLSSIAILRPSARLHSGYLRYYLDSADTRAMLKAGYVSGSAIPRVVLKDFRRAPIPVPPLTEQKAIAAVLGALDDKIELNRHMNATLEALARALFQSWFVDFDPVRAKLDGRKPTGFDDATAALFSNSFQESSLGHIPKGWTAGTVVEGFNLTMGQSPPGDTYNEEGNGLPFYQGRTDFGFRFPTRRIYCSDPTRYAKSGDTLVSVRAPVGDINMANEECCIGRGVAAVRHKSGATSFTYHSMANLYPDFACFEAEGTVFGSINKDSFEKLRFVMPPDEIVAAYERQAGPLDEQIRTLENQSRTLATLRDTLLPKLLSGELSPSRILDIIKI